MSEISVFEFKELLDSNQKIAILDVRENEELVFSKFENFLHIPLMLLQQEIDQWKTYSENAEHKVVICKSGIRSMKAVEFLNDTLNEKHLNLEGGINKYAQEIDTSIGLY